MKYKSFIALTIALLSLSCRTDTPQEEEVYAVSNISYIQDSRTGLCFAYMATTAHIGKHKALATVPCDRVQKLLPVRYENEHSNKD